MVDARQFGAKGDGQSDDTQAIQVALDRAATSTPICHLPPGTYVVRGALTVPPGVTLQGASGGVPHSEHPIGTVLLALGGRGQPDGAPLLTLKPNGVVRNLVIHCPEQTLSDVKPYPWTIRADGELCQILDLPREQIRHHGPGTLVLSACHFTGWDYAGKGDPCVRASNGRLIVNACEFMDTRKRPIVLEKGLKAAAISGCAFRGAPGVDDQSGAAVSVSGNVA